ncbi:MAG: TatD family hydrolase [Burkholderiales bacterium]|nr:TatD family hydrolase [Burkholderiales bacterium]
MLVDSHCHLDFDDFKDDLSGILERMVEAGVGHAVCIAVTLEALSAVRAVAAQSDRLFATVGVHPDYPDVREPDVRSLVELATDARTIAIGETGLDYYRLSGDLEWQRNRFRTHIRAARETGLPLVVHTRAAAADTLRILREERAHEAGGVMHCFTESLDFARAAIDMNFMISFSGIVTFRNARDLKEVAKAIPLERILVETDAPYLAPVPHRGKTNEPALVAHVAQEVARLRQIAFDDVVAATTMNFFRLFPKAARLSERT